MAKFGDALAANDLAAAAAECSIGLNSISRWSAEVWPAPDEQFQATVDAFFNELGTLFAYCSGGTETSMAMAAETGEVVFELWNKIETRLGRPLDDS